MGQIVLEFCGVTVCTYAKGGFYIVWSHGIRDISNDLYLKLRCMTKSQREEFAAAL